MRVNRAVVLLAAVVVMVGPLAPRAAALDAGGRAALDMLRAASTVQRRGQHNTLLQALRHLGDPALAPFFAHLAGQEHASLRIHGLLGQAAVSDSQRLTLEQLAPLTDAAVQARLVSAALNDDLLPAGHMKQMLTWSELDPGVKVVLAADLIAQGGFESPDVLRDAIDDTNAARRALAALLLHHIGELEQWTETAKLGELSGRGREAVFATLLRTAARHDIDSVSRWAFRVYQREGLPDSLRRLALRVAMRYGEAGSQEAWLRRFEEATGVADRIRLGLVALRLAPWLDAATYRPLIEADRTLLKKMGRAGEAIANESGKIPDRVVALVREHNHAANAWAISYAREEAAERDGQLILLGLILANREAENLSTPRQLQNIASAARALHRLNPEISPRLLRPVLRENPDTRHLVRGILLGLVRCRKAGASATVRALEEMPDLSAKNLVVLLRARDGETLSESELSNLRTLALGGGRIGPSLRVQAGWLYLKQTNQATAALNQLRAGSDG